MLRAAFRIRYLWLLALCVLLPSRVALAQQAADVPYVQTPWNVVDTMLEVALVSPGDYVIDLGSGDGRIVIQAARKHGARGMGVELDPNLVRAANEEAGRQGVAGKVSFVNGNLFNLDLGRATVLTLYLLPQINLQLRPRILSQLRPGTRVVSHDFGMDEWKPDQHREIAVPNKSYGPPVSQVYLWYVPANVAGKWRWRLTVGGQPRAYEARVSQWFQELDGEALVDGGSAVTRDLKLRGDRISFTLVRDLYGQRIVHEFSGRVDGDTATGRVRVAGGGENATLDWLATRVERGTLRTE